MQHTDEQNIEVLQTHPYSQIKRVIAFVSGKGGVGKSLLTSLTAVSLSRLGLKVAILDADLTGPSIAQSFFAAEEKAGLTAGALLPRESVGGIKILSMNMLLADAADAVIWRGPVLASMIRRFWSQTIWDEVDYLLLDLPPGTGDIPLTVFQSIRPDGVIVLTSPQTLVKGIVGKALRMCRELSIPILGMVENFSYFQCPDCQQCHELFGPSSAEEFCREEGIELLARLPIAPDYAALVDQSEIENADIGAVTPITERLLRVAPRSGFTFPDGPKGWNHCLKE